MNLEDSGWELCDRYCEWGRRYRLGGVEVRLSLTIKTENYVRYYRPVVNGKEIDRKTDSRQQAKQWAEEAAIEILSKMAADIARSVTRD